MKKEITMKRSRPGGFIEAKYLEKIESFFTDSKRKTGRDIDYRLLIVDY